MARAQALLLAAQPDTYRAALGYLVDWGRMGAAEWAHWAGLADGARLHRLHSETPLHIRFGADQHRAQLAGQASWFRPTWRLHPTWTGGRAKHDGRMGGRLEETCGSCHAPLQRLLQTDSAAVQEAAAGEITLGLCLDCCGWEEPLVRFYRHDASGRPVCHPSQHLDVPTAPTYSGDLMPSDVSLVELESARWRCQEWGQSNNRQNLSRVGGAPSWVQSDMYPECIDCGAEMRFVMQLDSTLPTTDGGILLWGSGGMLYTFWCATCRVSGHFWQCT